MYLWVLTMYISLLVINDSKLLIRFELIALMSNIHYEPKEVITTTMFIKYIM